MNKIEIGLQMYTVRDRINTLDDLKDTLNKIDKIGIKLLQMGVPGYLQPREFKNLLDGYGMKMDCVGFPFGGDAAQVEQTLKYAELFGTNLVQTGSIPGEYRADADGYKRYAEKLNIDGAALAAEGLKYIYHFHAFEFVTFGNIRGIDILLNETEKANVYFIPDVFWLTSAGVEPSSALKMFEGRTEWIHAKDYAILQLEGIIESVPYCFAPVGSGNLNWDGILKTSLDMGVYEFIIEQDQCQEDVFLSVSKSFNFLKSKLNI